MIHDINLAMIMKPIRQILSCTKDLKKLRLKDCGGIFKIILSMPSILNGSLEVMELDRNRLGIESIASLKDSGLKKILIIEEEDYLVPASGDAMNWDGFKSLNELIVKLPLTVFDSTYAQVSPPSLPKT